MTVNVEVKLKFTESGVSKGIAKVGEEQAKAIKKTEALTEQSNSRQRSSYEKLSQARETLGVRGERSIQREIQLTEAAYNRLANSGTLSARELNRAYDAQVNKIRELRRELGETNKLQSSLRAGGVIGAGVVAGAYTLKAPALAAMNFDERLAGMANTAFAERDISGRKIGMKQLEAAINKSVGPNGGGTRDQAAEALDALIASGAVSAKDSMTLLPQLMRASSASGASPQELANIGIRAMQTFKIKADDMPNVLNMALAAGQAGGFELKDMAKWLPQQMAAATMSGMSGRAGFAKLAALNQASAITAGTKDEAGNNVVNLLAKINSSDTANDAKKLGINLPSYLQAQRKKGFDSVDAFAALVDKTVAGRADYQALKKQLASSKNSDDKRAALESMTTIAQGAGIGKIIQDRQALMALLGLMNNRDYLKEVLRKVKANDVSTGGAIDSNYGLMSDTSSFKLRQAEQQKDIGQKAILDGLTPTIGKLSNAFTDLAQKHPALAGAATLATTGLIAVAGASGLASLAIGGGKAGAAGAIARTASKFLPGIGRLGAIGLGAVAGDAALEYGFGEESPITRYGKSAINGAAIGAAAGSFIPGVGNAAGALVGGGLGFLTQVIHDAMSAPENQAKIQSEIKVSVSDDRVRVTGQSTNTQGPVSNVINTGNLWGIPG